MDKWSEEWLPQDVFDQILNLCSLRDSIRVGLVCKLWHRVSKLNISRRPQLPWLMPCNPNSKSAEEAGEENRCLYSLSDDTIYCGINILEIRGKTCCGSFLNSDGWLMCIYQDEVQLFHPWRRIHLKLPNLPDDYDIRDNRSRIRAYRIIIQKVAMSDDAAVVVVLTILHNFAFCRRTRRKKGNIWITIHPDKRYDDIIYHNGKFYAVRSNGAIGVLHINTRNPHVETLTGKVNFIPRQRRQPRPVRQCKTYLVQDSTCECIFIIKRIYIIKRIRTVDFVNGRNVHSTFDFQVYKLGIEEIRGTYKKTLVEVENLGNRVIFLGLNSSMIVMANQFSGFKGNCIYFTHDWVPRVSRESVDMGIFNMEDRTFLPLFPNGAHPSFLRCIWIRPPPRWNSGSPNQISSSGGSCPCLPGLENWKVLVSN